MAAGVRAPESSAECKRCFFFLNSQLCAQCHHCTCTPMHNVDKKYLGFEWGWKIGAKWTKMILFFVNAERQGCVLIQYSAAKVASCFCSHDVNLFWDYMNKIDFKKYRVCWDHLEFPALTDISRFLSVYCWVICDLQSVFTVRNAAVPVLYLPEGSTLFFSLPLIPLVVFSHVAFLAVVNEEKSKQWKAGRGAEVVGIHAERTKKDGVLVYFREQTTLLY